MEIFSISYQQIKIFFLILVRIGTVLFMLPFFNSRVIPILSKAGFALVITIILYPVLGNVVAEFPNTVIGMGQLIVAELMFGIILGLLVQIFFEGVQMMGQLVGFQTGFAITNIIDPQSGVQISIFSNMAFFVAIILFLLLNGHHILLGALKESYEILPVGGLALNSEMLNKLIYLYGDMFVIALKIGAPVIAALLFTQVAFGLITKFIPQMNIMIVAFPVQIVIGLLFFGVSLNVLLSFMDTYLNGLGSLLRSATTWLKV
ncbi:MAG: flagellar biosynthetic protein FliR [Proteobacteria bacterium]|nr:flagellar biosynthetic protein FliR [Pseudomonadota bacterium]